MEYRKEPKVSLVGAGPGSEDLITMRGYRTLQSADVILYDALISKALLDSLSCDIPKIYVGKRCGEHSFTQDNINRLIVENAFKYGNVVRLKGGDPFVFGRACEEIEYVESFGIAVNIVPGLSSALAVPSGQGIPMTKRGTSSSFWVLTATQSNGRFSEDLELASRSSATMVVLMGIRKLMEIVEEVIKYRCSSTPIAIIQNGTLSNETQLVSTLENVSYQLTDLRESGPGVIVIGDVVAEHPDFYEEEVRRVLYTGM